MKPENENETPSEGEEAFKGDKGELFGKPAEEPLETREATDAEVEADSKPQESESTADSLKPEKAEKKGKKGKAKEKKAKVAKPKKEPKPPKPEREIIASAAEFEEQTVAPPGEIEVETVKDKEKGTVEVEAVTIITTVKGKESRFRLAGWALHKFYEKSHRTLKMLYKDLRSAKPKEQAALLTKAFNARKEPLKLLVSNGIVVSVVSPRHKQFSLEETRSQIQKAIAKVIGQVKMEQLGTHTLFRLPIDNKYVSAWLRIMPGNNLAKGPSAIHFSSTFRTEYDTKTKGKAPACLNWANVWTVPQTLFNVKGKRLHDLASEIGADTVGILTGRNIHTLNKAGIDVENFQAYVNGLMKAVPAMNRVIEDSIHTPLKKPEMTAILAAYGEKVGLPRYLQKDIMDEVEEETVWGLSQAVSYVRTHNEYRGIVDSKGEPMHDREDVRITRVLENIAGEVYSISPMIKDLQSKEGEITYKVLGIKPPKEPKPKPEPKKVKEKVAPVQKA
jgi:hypothetical protein